MRELLERLNEVDPELDILMQKDEEGNGYRHLHGADDQGYVEDLQAYRPEVVDSEYMDEDELEDYTRVLILF